MQKKMNVLTFYIKFRQNDLLWFEFNIEVWIILLGLFFGQGSHYLGNPVSWKSLACLWKCSDSCIFKSFNVCQKCCSEGVYQLCCWILRMWAPCQTKQLQRWSITSLVHFFASVCRNVAEWVMIYKSIDPVFSFRKDNDKENWCWAFCVICIQYQMNNIKWTSVKNEHCYIGLVYVLFFDKHAQLVLEVRLYIFAVYKYKLKYKSLHSSTASEYVTHTWSIRPPCHFYSSSSPHLLNIYVGHRAAAVLLNIY